MSRIEDDIEKANCLRQNQAAGRGSAEPEVPAPLGPPRAGGYRSFGLGVAFFLLVGFGAYLLAENMQTPTPSKSRGGELSAAVHPTVPQPAVEKSPVPGNGLPDFIPLDAPDATYASAHPGWQRYVGKTMEFRVFREGGALKAIQVISRQDKALTQELFASFLVETAGTERFKVLSRAQREGYFVEKGTVGSRAEVIVYRKKPAGEIRALVVAYR